MPITRIRETTFVDAKKPPKKAVPKKKIRARH